MDAADEMGPVAHSPGGSNGLGPSARGEGGEPPRRRLRTRAVLAGEDHRVEARPLSDPISPGTAYAFRDAGLADRRRLAVPPEPNYGRDGLPNVRSLERAVADLEGAEDAHAAASGMAAVSLTLLALLGAGDLVLVSADCYCETRAVLTDELARFGVRVAFVDPTDHAAVERGLAAGPRLLYVETLSNPGLRLVDLPRVARLAAAAGALLVVDNTLATPLLCRPLDHGADLVVHSATKFLGGHHDLTAGVAAGRADLIAAVRRCGHRFGSTLGPFDAWLALRGIKTLAPRLAWIGASSLRVAAFLGDHPAVSCVRYPGLPGDSQAALARRLLPDGAGGIVTFDLAGGAAAAALAVDRLRLIPYALSFGGTTTTVCYPPRDEVAGAGFSYRCATLRLSIGLEDADDLIEDLAWALGAVPATVAANEPRERVVR